MRLACLLLLAALIGIAFPTHAVAAGGRVLVLYSFDDSLPWQRLLRKGLLDRVAEAPPPARPALYEERVDAHRLGEEAAFAGLAGHLARKYAAIGFDVVIAESFYAAEFLRRNPELFPGARRFYVNHAITGWTPADGIEIRVGEDYLEAIAAIPRVMAGIGRLVVVTDRSDIQRQRLEDLLPVLERYRTRWTIEIWDSYTFDELDRRAAALPADTAIFYMPVLIDHAGAKVNPFEIARRLTAAAAVPVFVNYDSLLGSGVVGGHVLSAERLGRAMGAIALGEITDASGAAASGRAANAPVFDHGPFRRFGLREEGLPADAALRNRPPSLWETYRWQLVGAAVAFLLQTALLVALIATLRGRNVAMRELGREKYLAAVRNRELERRNDELEVLAYVASHDLREPLRTINIYVTLLEQRCSRALDDEGHTFVGFVRDAAKRANQLVLDLLEYLQVGQGAEPARQVDPAAVVRTAVAALGGLAAETGARVSVAESLPCLVMAESELSSLLGNLIANAMKYRHPDRAPEIGVSARREGGEWVFCVSDNGVGIEPQYTEKVFVLFQRLDPRAVPDGTGIGLSICRKIVTKYGGRIWVESVPGTGSRFLFTLPEAGGTVPPAASAAAVTNLPRSANSHNRAPARPES